MAGGRERGARGDTRAVVAFGDLGGGQRNMVYGVVSGLATSVVV